MQARAAARFLELMLFNMVVGRPPGVYDHLLEFTHPVTGTNFFGATGVSFGSMRERPARLKPLISVP